MREIKFRAWLDNKMIYGEPNYIWDMTTESDPKMQYTGLKDKNGKEIYEGDILIKDNPNRHLNDKSLKPARVKWDIQGVGFNIRDPKFIRQSPYTYEIIGNIYENPELVNTL